MGTCQLRARVEQVSDHSVAIQSVQYMLTELMRNLQYDTEPVQLSFFSALPTADSSSSVTLFAAFHHLPLENSTPKQVAMVVQVNVRARLISFGMVQAVQPTDSEFQRVQGQCRVAQAAQMQQELG